ncbi:type 1 glutamine amidotransferase [Planktotalea arctica]|uniref:type 1 glutamine amidotransferase n=1 Tax=Planktotalea arctica TaxID=1481893 RepID=UPI00321B181A
MKIGILQAGHAAPAVKDASGDYEFMYSKMLDADDFTYQTWSVVDMEFPKGPSDADGWLISGSKHGAYEDHAFIPPLEKLIRAITAAGRPLVGVCFGHQIIAQALGGTVEKFGGGWAVGRNEYDIAGEKFHLNAWHQDQVTALPEGAERVGSNQFCQNAMISYAGKALTIQPHPEFDAGAVTGLLETRAGTVPADLQAKARANLPLPDDNKAMGKRLAHFLRTKSFT